MQFIIEKFIFSAFNVIFQYTCMWIYIIQWVTRPITLASCDRAVLTLYCTLELDCTLALHCMLELDCTLALHCMLELDCTLALHCTLTLHCMLALPWRCDLISGLPRIQGPLKQGNGDHCEEGSISWSFRLHVLFDFQFV